jgi:addiction module HigA family antidote
MVILRDDVARMAFEGEALAPVTPGEVLREEYMRPLGLSARALAREMQVPPNRIAEIVTGQRAISAQTAILLGRRFGTSARFWMSLQVAHDLALAERAMLSAA